MKPLLPFIFSLLLWGSHCRAQDSLQTVGEGQTYAFLYADYGKGIESLFNKQSKWELATGINLAGKWRINLEFGSGNLNPANVINNGNYNAHGYYYRGGVDYVFTIKPGRTLATGIMYAASRFDDSGYAEIQSELWDDLQAGFTRSNLTAAWMEWILHTEGPVFHKDNGIWHNFYWGIRGRLRFLLTPIKQPDFDIYAIPGYGKTFSRVVPAANFFLSYRFNLK